MSHVFNDTGDACQTLLNLTLLPLVPGAATFTVGDVEAVLARTASGRVALPKVLTLAVNETWTRSTGADLADAFTAALV